MRKMTKESTTKEGFMKLNTRETGSSTLNVVCGLGAVGTVLVLLTGTGLSMKDVITDIAALDDQQMIHVAADIEEWSVANPQHPLAYQQDIYFHQLREQTGINFDTTKKYDIHRTPDSIMCFVEESNGSKTYAVSLEESMTVDYNEHC